MTFEIVNEGGLFGFESPKDVLPSSQNIIRYRLSIHSLIYMYASIYLNTDKKGGKRTIFWNLGSIVFSIEVEFFLLMLGAKIGG
jgi:hypothetical protein